MESTTAANFQGAPKERIKLGNGQIREVTDGSSGTLSTSGATKATVRKGLFGSFIMAFQGLNRAPGVRRVE